MINWGSQMTSADHARKNIKDRARVTLGAILVCLGSSALAQTPPRNLANLPGYTPVQQPTGGMVQDVCGRLAGELAPSPPKLGASDTGNPQQRLYSSCRKMVQTANDLANDGTPVANSLGLTNDELRTGVQAVAPVQMNAQKQMTAEASRNNIVFSRLLDLRGGGRRSI
jgi:hypothetical protein